MLARCYLYGRMSKRLKLEVLSSPRCLRSAKKVSDSDLSSETSAYFDNDDTVPAKVEKKKRATVEAKHEELKKNNQSIDAPAKIERKKRTPVKIINEQSEKNNLKSIDAPAKIERKKRTHIKIKCDTPEVNIDAKNVDTNGSVETKQDDVKTDEIKVDRVKWMPTNWEAILENIKEMRKHRTAPVDEMGCHKCADPKASAKVSRFQSLIALMLSSQTKDQITHSVMQRLRTYGCTPESIAGTPEDVLGKLIYPVGFWKKKAKYIKEASKILINEYESDIPRTLKELCQLPGVGPKMGHICMQIAWGKVSGIGVDTHVHRICNRLEWAKKPTKTPQDTRMALEDWLPKDLWSEVNHLLVGFGQEICFPRFPNCGECLNKDICPYAAKNGIRKK